VTAVVPVPAVAVLYTNRPVAGLAILGVAKVASSVPCKATLGGRNPWLDAFTSSLADAFSIPVVPMPTCAIPNSGQSKKDSKIDLINYHFTISTVINFLK
jgi:hypothetical protein